MLRMTAPFSPFPGLVAACDTEALAGDELGVSEVLLCAARCLPWDSTAAQTQTASG